MNNKEGLVAISEVIQNLKSISEQPTYEQGFERGKQVGYKEGWRARSEDTTEEKEIEIIDEMKKLKSSLDKLKSMGLSVTYNTYYSLIEELRENNIILA